MYEAPRAPLPVRDEIAEAHATAWQRIASPGPHLDAAERVAVARETRMAAACALCERRREALSPYWRSAEEGGHDVGAGAVPLTALEIEAVHRIATDPGRLTRRWLDRLLEAGIGAERYIELVSIVSTTTVVDTFNVGLGRPLPPLPEPEAGGPTGEAAPDVVDAGGWLPLSAAEEDWAERGLPRVPNIARAMGLSPAANALFLGVMTRHYGLYEHGLALERPQIEHLASTVSTLNACYY